MWSALNWVSTAIHGLIFGAPHMTLCARAWWMRDKLFWRCWVRFWDLVFRWVERDHCRMNYQRRWK
jgi:hypothetical protein